MRPDTRRWRDREREGRLDAALRKTVRGKNLADREGGEEFGERERKRRRRHGEFGRAAEGKWQVGDGDWLGGGVMRESKGQAAGEGAAGQRE